MAISDLSKADRDATLERTLKAFAEFCRIEFQFELYDYQLRVARACLSSLFVEPADVFIKIARQSGKTEKRSNELDPMLASTGGVTWMVGVGCTRNCDFKRGCDGELPGPVAIALLAGSAGGIGEILFV